MSGSGDVLMMRGAHARLAAELAPFDDMLLLMDADGQVRHAATGAIVCDPQPAGIWYGRDAWFQPATAALLDCALRSPRLVWMHSGNAGIDTPAYAPFIERGIRITTSHGFAPGIADYVLAGVLDHVQRGPERRAMRAARRWDALPFRDVSDSRWLIVGFGAIGREVARRAKGFGALVTGVRRSGGSDPLADLILFPDQVHQALGDADIVVLCTSLTPQTRGLADSGFFAAMKPGAVLVNVGRGALIDEAALLAGLADGRPGHAILDVFAREPLDATSPFWDHSNVTMTPHLSWDSAGAAARNDATFLEHLSTFAADPLGRGEALRDGMTARFA